MDRSRCFGGTRRRGQVSLRLALLLIAGLILASCRGARTPRPTPVVPLPATSTPVPTTAYGATPAPAPSVPAGPTGVPTTLPPTIIEGGGERLLGTYVPPLSAAQYCQQMAGDGARFTWTAIPWDGIEPIQGVFNYRRADQVIGAMRSCGLEIGVHILSRNAWATQPVPNIPSKSTASMPPKDMNQYYNFVYQLAKHYKGQIARYSIENEAHASSNWPASPQEYFQLLQTGYKAVHDADPNAIVEDAALSSSGLGVLIANDLLKQGKRQDALAWMQSYFAQFAPVSGAGEPITPRSNQDLDNLMAQPEVQRILTWAPMLWDNSKYYDVEQLHYFGPWEDLPYVMDWIHAQLKARGNDKPLDLWEMGYATTDLQHFNPDEQAQEVPKYLAVSLGEGAQRTVQWLYTDIAFQAEGHPGLITDKGPRPAETTFRVVTGKLNGTVTSERLSLGPGVWAYRFDKSNGSSVWMLWSTQTTRVSLPISAQSVMVTDMMGQSKAGDPKALDVGVQPIYVEPVS